MNSNVRDCLVSDYEELIPGLSLPDVNDRHVLAAAIKCSASIILMFNVSDFPSTSIAKYGIEAVDPDDFLMSQLGLAKHAVLRAAKRQRESLKNPPKSIDEFLSLLEQQRLVQTAGELRRYRDFI